MMQTSIWVANWTTAGYVLVALGATGEGVVAFIIAAGVLLADTRGGNNAKAGLGKRD